ncbi:hypothetical protein ALI22I_03830 [Saccharothrix sp. ALI-22-I]|uniref:hypothetical protein n=1 Tax=Saccharothrix sp. ALI-22-I TaxID=1933778 RepID=UPI00097C2E72|nr:hypothetical protein [Saccharothrix sp. ALI-22-I]ONI92401.1 hypothetical protein ALI22I_03830 [Saccharothrix sp. ALI-22-I]
MKELIPLVVGFLLTTVLGGLLGFFFQRRTWAHQHRVQTRDREWQRAVQVFEEVSRLLDKRLYRLRLLYWSLNTDKDARSEQSEKRMEDYREVLREWNDSINRNLALIQQYFGIAARQRFDNGIGAIFVVLGRDVEAMWRRFDGGTGSPGPRINDQKLEALGSQIYAYNLEMIRAIQGGTVGWLVADNRRSLTRDDDGRKSA